MSCKHKNNVWIQITQTVVSEINVVDGQAQVDEGDPSPTHYELHCGECGDVLYWPASRVPKWVLAIIAESHPDGL